MADDKDKEAERFRKEQAEAAADEAKAAAKDEARPATDLKAELDEQFAARQAAEAARADEGNSRPAVDERDLPEPKSGKD